MQFSDIRFDINVIRMYIMNSKNSKAIEDSFKNILVSFGRQCLPIPLGSSISTFHLVFRASLSSGKLSYLLDNIDRILQQMPSVDINTRFQQF